LFAGSKYEALARLLDPNKEAPLTLQNKEFITIHKLASNGTLPVQPATVEELETLLGSNNVNQVVLLRGYPQPDLLRYIGSRLRVEYEYFFQHLSNPRQVNLSEMYSHPPLLAPSSGTIQLTFTSIGSWDVHKSGSSLAAARSTFVQDMNGYLEDMNLGRHMAPSDTMVRSFWVYDLKHFAIEQQLTMTLLRKLGKWTALIWSDFGAGSARRGPWMRMQSQHASNPVRFLEWPLEHTRQQIHHMTRQSRPPIQDGLAEKTSPLLCQPLSSLGTNLDFVATSVAAMKQQEKPFALLTIFFSLWASSEYQFLNLMEQKVAEFGRPGDQGIDGIQAIKKQVDAHRERIQDVLEVIKVQGGDKWSILATKEQSPSPRSESVPRMRQAADETGSYQPQIYDKLLRRAAAVSVACSDEMTKLSNESIVHEAQRTMKQTGAIGRVTFIASVFVPLAFATSIFGMNLQELNGEGPSVTVFIAVMVPVMVTSLVAWGLNRETALKIRGLVSFSGDRNVQ